MPVYIFVNHKGEFFNNYRTRLEVQLGKCLFLELNYELYIKNKNIDCVESRPDSCQCTNYDKGRLYDDCTQHALEKILRENINCVVPFIQTNHTNVCRNSSNIKKVKLFRQSYQLHSHTILIISRIKDF